MAVLKTGRADGPERMTDYGRTKLAAEYNALDGERIKLQAAARTKADRQKEIEGLLCEQLLFDHADICDLSRWQFGYELVAGSMSYKDELVKEIGEVEFGRRKDAVPQKEKFFLHDKGRPSTKTRTLASPRARHKPKKKAA